jgi:hypothetical protein
MMWRLTKEAAAGALDVFARSGLRKPGSNEKKLTLRPKRFFGKSGSAAESMHI